MLRPLIAIALLIAVPAMAADTRARTPAAAYDLWTVQQGENDTFHGVWVVNASSGMVCRCFQVAGSAMCVEAKMMTADEWSRLARQNQQAPPKR